MKLILSPELLTIRLERSEQIAAMRARVIIKRDEISNVRWCDTFEEWRRWEVRMPGSSIPNRLIAGSYWTEEGWDFLYIRRPIGVTNTVALNVTVIELKDHDKFTRVVFSSDEDDFQHIKGWLQKIPNRKSPKTKNANPSQKMGKRRKAY